MMSDGRLAQKNVCRDVKMRKPLIVCKLVTVIVSVCFCDECRDSGFPFHENDSHGVGTFLGPDFDVPFSNSSLDRCKTVSEYLEPIRHTVQIFRGNIRGF